MTRIQLLLSVTLFAVTLVPALATEQFECPSPFKPNTPAKLEEINGLLPNVDAMGNIGQLKITIDTLRREGMSKSLIIDHLIGAYCPMVAGLDIIINVPLTPDVVDIVNATAKKQGLSATAWIAMAIDNALQQQSAARPPQ
jgi:hypothetical protein